MLGSVIHLDTISSGVYIVKGSGGTLIKVSVVIDLCVGFYGMVCCPMTMGKGFELVLQLQMKSTKMQTLGANIWACARAQAFENVHALMTM